MASNIDHQAVTKILQTLKSEGEMSFSESNDSAIEREIQKTHDCHNGSETGVKSIYKISCELSCQCSGGADSHSTTAFAAKYEEEKRYQFLRSIYLWNAEEQKRYEFLIRLFNTVHVDSITILKELISIKDDKKPHLDCVSKSSFPTRTRVSIEQVLLRKTVVLLISDLDIVEEEIFTLNQSHYERMTRSDLQYEIVWIPVVDRSTPSDQANRKKFEQLQEKMPWYTVVDPWLLDPVVVRYIKEVWHFSKKLILVVLDPQGKVVCNNALHMFRIWGNGAYPFTAAREESLWMGESWTLDLLVKTIDQTIVERNSQGKVICLYGGLDMEWIREVTDIAKLVAQTAGITMEMFYVGNRNAKERVEKITSTITAEKLSQCLSDPARIGYFWTRLENMWYSRTQYGKTVENDKILQEVSSMLSFGESYQGWAIISKGSDMVTANGDTILKIFNNLHTPNCLKIFKEFRLCSAETDIILPALVQKRGGFSTALDGHIAIQRKCHHCNKLTLPSARVGIPDKMACRL